MQLLGLIGSTRLVGFDLFTCFFHWSCSSGGWIAQIGSFSPIGANHVAGTIPPNGWSGPFGAVVWLVRLLRRSDLSCWDKVPVHTR
jgi:hypothetical protein